jgi:hypothetical protein
MVSAADISLNVKPTVGVPSTTTAVSVAVENAAKPAGLGMVPLALTIAVARFAA